MTPSALLAIGLGFALVPATFALRGQAQSARLKLRLAGLATRGDVTDHERRGTETLERLLLCTGKDREEVVTALRGAGIHGARAVLVFAALRILGTLSAAAIAFFAMRAGHHPGRAPTVAIIALSVTFLLSKVILRSRVAAYGRRVGKELPFVLDTLLLLLESGISLDQAFRYIAQSQLGGMELTRAAVSAMVDDLQNGMPYGLALDRWADRLLVPGVRELATLFKQALLNGSELGPTLRAFTREFADKRLSSARASIGRKTTHMTVVMIVFMMPALMIVLAGPAFVAVKGALHSMGSHK